MRRQRAAPLPRHREGTLVAGALPESVQGLEDHAEAAAEECR
jgi:hypothetical protein